LNRSNGNPVIAGGAAVSWISAFPGTFMSAPSAFFLDQ
jgi:hypothetical protein